MVDFNKPVKKLLDHLHYKEGVSGWQLVYIFVIVSSHKRITHYIRNVDVNDSLTSGILGYRNLGIHYIDPWIFPK